METVTTTVEDFLSEQESEKVLKWIIGSQLSEEDKKKIAWKLDEWKMNFIIEHLSNQKWRIENLYCIVDEDRNKIAFIPNYIQRQIVQAVIDWDDDYIRHIILKYRQGWVSTLFTIILLDEFLWGWRNLYNVIIAHERKLLISLFKKIRFALDNMDPAFKIFIPQMDSDNANELFIKKTNNRLAVTLDTRWETPTRIHITELAWREFAKQSSLLLAVNPLRKCKITIESTANWIWDPFYNIVQEARKWSWTYKLLFYPWYIEERNKTALPFWYGLNEDEILETRKTWWKHYRINYTDKEKQLKTLYNLTDEQVYWRRTQIADAMALWEDWNKKFDQENPDSIDTAFVASGTQVFDLSLSYKINKPIAEIWDFKIFGPPEDWMVFGIDTAEWWKAWDYSTIVWVSRKWKTLITFRKKCEDFQLAEAMDRIFNLEYEWKYFVWTIQVERNKWSAFIAEARRYDWFYLMLKWRDPTATSDDTKEYYWFWTWWWSKELLIRDFRKWIYNWQLEITEQIYSEISTYIYNNWKAEAMSWKHDDLIMAFMIAYNWVLYEYFIATYAETKLERQNVNVLAKFDQQILSWDFEQNEYSDWDEM